MAKNTICLNMIVKDESHIIEKTLNNLFTILFIIYLLFELITSIFLLKSNIYFILFLFYYHENVHHQ